MREEFEKWFKVRYPEKKYQAVKEVMYDAFLSGAEVGQRILEAAQQSVHLTGATRPHVGDPCVYCGATITEQSTNPCPGK